MAYLRASIRDHRQFALAVLLLALCIKAVVPAGFMIAPSADRFITVTVCSDATGGLQQMQIAIASQDEGGGHPDTAPKSDACAFSGLAKFATGGTDAMVLASALAFIMVLGLAPRLRLPSRQFAHIRPPLRGPPAAG